MAQIIGGLTTSHIPAIGKAIANQQQDEPYWQGFFSSYPPAREWLDLHKPDVAIVIYNDHGMNFFLDKMPTFAIGAALEYHNADEGWGLPKMDPYAGDAALSWHIIEQMVDDEFDITKSIGTDLKRCLLSKYMLISASCFADETPASMRNSCKRCATYTNLSSYPVSTLRSSSCTPTGAEVLLFTKGRPPK